ncbi:uncharacterized protein PRCAT00005277001 [Priceomyces carsonii]|uniref:uncharacterized protein n=1 Tax=Priceomyces carsonii TaxID=28549 RepID=UPI002EDB092C|nr:unnamed protein product [Priceomyces carsonii]
MLVARGVDSSSLPLTPTYHGYIGSTKDGLLIMQAVLNKKLKLAHRRPHDHEKSSLIRSGNIFVFIEAKSGIKRWTDGISWSPSRILGRFLIYRELNKSTYKGREEKKKKRRQSIDLDLSESIVTNTQQFYKEQGVQIGEHTLETTPPLHLSNQKKSHKFKEHGLIKKAMSITTTSGNLNFDNRNEKQVIHLVSYYNANEVLEDKLRRPSETDLKHEIIDDQLWIAAKNSAIGTKAQEEVETKGTLVRNLPFEGILPPDQQHKLLYSQENGSIYSEPFQHSMVQNKTQMIPQRPHDNYLLQDTCQKPFGSPSKDYNQFGNNPAPQIADYADTNQQNVGNIRFDSAQNHPKNIPFPLRAHRKHENSRIKALVQQVPNESSYFNPLVEERHIHEHNFPSIDSNFLPGTGFASRIEVTQQQQQPTERVIYTNIYSNENRLAHVSQERFNPNQGGLSLQHPNPINNRVGSLLSGEYSIGGLSSGSISPGDSSNQVNSVLGSFNELPPSILGTEPNVARGGNDIWYSSNPLDEANSDVQAMHRSFNHRHETNSYQVPVSHQTFVGELNDENTQGQISNFNIRNQNNLGPR